MSSVGLIPLQVLVMGTFIATTFTTGSPMHLSNTELTIDFTSSVYLIYLPLCVCTCVRVCVCVRVSVCVVGAAGVFYCCGFEVNVVF